MSINISVPITIPLDLVASIKKQAQSGEPIDRDAISITIGANIETIIDSIIAVPYDITPRNSISTDRRKVDEGLSFQITVKTLTGRKIFVHTTKETTAAQLAQTVETKEGLPPYSHRLIWNGSEIFNGAIVDEEAAKNEKTMEELGIGKDATVHLEFA